MTDTLLASPECVQSMKAAGIYGHILHFKSTGGGSRLPGEQPRAAKPISQSLDQESRLVLHGGGGGGGGGGGNTLVSRGYGDSSAPAVNQRGNEKALSYFSRCLAILELEEESELSEETLKRAYKSAGRKAHPDKGGSEEQFEAVTRAYAYLVDILKRIHGGRTKTVAVESPSLLGAQRSVEADKWKHIEPVKLNPKNLNMDAFNSMFEKTKMPSPDDDGYGDWLKASETNSTAPRFSGKYNRELFNSMFEESMGRDEGRRENSSLALTQPQALTMAPMMGDEIGRDRTEDFTAPANANMKYTDLKRAYTQENTFSHQVAGVRVAERSMKQVEAERGRAPDPMTDLERAAHQAAEEAMSSRETARQRRAREQASMENEYFERMKRLVIQ